MIVENFFKRCNKCVNYRQDSAKFMQRTCLYSRQPTTYETICPIPKSFVEKPENYSAKVGYCFKCKHYFCNDPANLRGICYKYKIRVKGNDPCRNTVMSFEEREEGKMNIKFGELLPLIKCKFVVEYKSEIYHSFGNTLQSVLREHFKDLTVKELTTYDEECLKVVIK